KFNNRSDYIMTYYLQNSELKVTVQSKGAELTSIIAKKNNLEYLWQADPAYWNRHAPILFPIVGRLKDNKYSYEGQEFELSQHGFARDLEFTVQQNDDTSLQCVLEYQTATYGKYPFKFNLEISYVLDAATISVIYKVKNTDQKEIYFSIGAHPAFNCPLIKGQKFEDYSLFFGQTEDNNRHLLSDGLFTGKQEAIPVTECELPLAYPLFEKDAIVLKKIKSEAVTLKSRKSGDGVKIS